MREETKRAKLAELFGLEAPKNETPPTVMQATASREAEATLAYVKEPEKFRKIECRHCGKTFAVNRANVSCCSDKCRAGELAALGIEWDFTRDPAERWVGDFFGEPLTVPPAALELADRALTERAAVVATELPQQESQAPAHTQADQTQEELDPVVAEALGLL